MWDLRKLVTSQPLPAPPPPQRPVVASARASWLSPRSPQSSPHSCSGRRRDRNRSSRRNPRPCGVSRQRVRARQRRSARAPRLPTHRLRPCPQRAQRLRKLRLPYPRRWINSCYRCHPCHRGQPPGRCRSCVRHTNSPRAILRSCATSRVSADANKTGIGRTKTASSRRGTARAASPGGNDTA